MTTIKLYYYVEFSGSFLFYRRESMEYLYDNTLFSSKQSVMERVKENCLNKCSEVKVQKAIQDLQVEISDLNDSWVRVPRWYADKDIFRNKGIFNGTASELLTVSQETIYGVTKTVFVDIYKTPDNLKEGLMKGRECIIGTISRLFRKEYEYYTTSGETSKGVFSLLNYVISMKVSNIDINWQNLHGVRLYFRCVQFMEGKYDTACVEFFLNFKDYSLTCKDYKYVNILLEEDVEEWAEFINSSYDFEDELTIEDVAGIRVREDAKSVLFSGEKYLRYLVNREQEGIQASEDLFSKANIGDNVDCFSSPDGVNYYYTGAKSKYADVHMEKDEKVELNKYYVYKDRMGFVIISRGNLTYGSIVPVENINGKTVMYGLKMTSKKMANLFSNDYITCLTESISVLQSTISELEGKVYGEYNYLGDMIKNSKYYRYAGLLGIKDCKFSTLFKFDNAIYAFIRYNGTIKLLVSRAKTAEEKKQLVQNIKKVVSIDSFRKLCVKRVYVFNIYQAKSKLSASLNLSKKYMGNYTDFDKLLELSKSDKNTVFSVFCINKETNDIESKLVLENGSVISIDGVDIEC